MQSYPPPFEEPAYCELNEYTNSLNKLRKHVTTVVSFPIFVETATLLLPLREEKILDRKSSVCRSSRAIIRDTRLVAWILHNFGRL